MNSDSKVLERLKKALTQRQKVFITSSGLKPSAVLVPIFVKEEYHILFTKRTNKVKAHKGQISFPGGAHEKEDASLLDTALRESSEEIGLNPSDVEILGEMDDTPTVVSRFAISPFVGVFHWPYQFRLDPWEVDSLLEVPIPALLNPDNRHPEPKNIWGSGIKSYSYHYQGDIIWGASARILYQFLDIYSQAMGNGGKIGRG